MKRYNVINRNNYVSPREAEGEPNTHGFLGAEYNSGEQKTIPNMDIPLRELVSRYTRGQAIPIIPASFDSDEDRLELPDLTMMDKVEKIQLMMDVKKGIANLQRQLVLEQQQKEQEQKEQQSPPSKEESVS